MSINIREEVVVSENKEITLYLTSGTILTGKAIASTHAALTIKAGPTVITIAQEFICAVGVESD